MTIRVDSGGGVRVRRKQAPVVKRSPVFTQPIGRVSPVGQSPSQGALRKSATRVAQRQQIASTRQIIQQQQTSPIRAELNRQGTPKALRVANALDRTAQQRVDRHIQHIALQNVASVQDRVKNPQQANRVLYGQAVGQLRRTADIGRLTSIWTNPKVPLEHRVGAIRKLRNTYNVPVSQQTYGALRQAQHFHEFLTTGKAGDTAQAPSNLQGEWLTGPTKGQPVSLMQTYQLRKSGGKLVPVAVFKDQSMLDKIAGRGPHYFNEQDKINPGADGIARGFTHAGIDTAHFGAKLIPDGTVGTPLKRGITDIAALGPNTITGLYGLGSAAVSAATGDTKPIKALAHSFAENDPLGRLIVHGDTKAIAQHPGIALAEILGGGKALDNIAGRVDRGGGFRRPNAPPVRDLRTAPLTGLARQDRYSKGYLTSRVQVARDAKIDAKFNDLRGQAVTEALKGKAAQAAGDHVAAAGHLKAAQGLAVQAERFNRTRMREGHTIHGPRRNPVGASDLQKLYDVTEGTNQATQRAGRNEGTTQLLGKRAVREKNRTGPVVLKGAEGEVQGLIAEMRVAPNRAELTKLAKRLSGQQKFLTDHHEIATNRAIVSSIFDVLKTHSDEQLRLLGDEAARYARVNVKMHDEAKAAQILHPEEARMSALKPFAVEQLGAVPNAEGKLVLHRQAPADMSHWQMKVRVARDDLSRARSREGGASSGEILKKQRALKVAVDRLKSERAKGPVKVEHVLTASEIEKAAHAYADKHPGAMRPGEQAFISHSSRIKGGGSFNIRSDTAKGLSRAKRTGTAVLYGTASVGREAMIGSALKLRNMVSHAESWRQTVGQAAVRDPQRLHAASGHHEPIQEPNAKAALEKFNALMTDPHTGLPVPGAFEGVAVRLNPLGGRAEQLAETLHQADEEGFLPGNEHPIADAIQQNLQDALKGDTSKPGPYTVFPKETVERALEHSKVASGQVAALRSVSQAFRHTVLPFSPTWLTGNVVESLGRSAVAGWHPGDTALERRVLSEWAKLGPVAAKRFVLSVGTGHFGSVRAIQVRATANTLDGGIVRPIRQMAEVILNAPKVGGKVQLGADAIQAYTQWMMNDVNGTMESAIKHGMVGTQMRHLLLPHDLAKTSAEAARAIAGELHSNPAAVDELIHAVTRAYGQYENFTPEVRKTLLAYTPFGAWLLNATNFLVRVLPADHPGLVALMAANASATQQYRREHQLDATLANEKGGGQRPAFLQGSIPTPAWFARLVGAQPGDPIRIARFTPFGIAADPMSGIASAFIPFLPLDALQGRDFTGRQVRNADGTTQDPSQSAWFFVKSFVAATVPIIGVAGRIAAKGPLGFINPVQPVTQKPKATSKSAGMYPGGGTGASVKSMLPGGSSGGVASMMP